MIEEERKAARGNPERETRIWLEKIAEADRQRARAQDLAVEGLLSPDELRGKLATPRRAARNGRAQPRSAARPKGAPRGPGAKSGRDAGAIRQHHPEGLDLFTPEDRHQAYKELRLKVIAHPDGSIEAEGVFNMDELASLLCTGESARSC